MNINMLKKLIKAKDLELEQQLSIIKNIEQQIIELGRKISQINQELLYEKSLASQSINNRIDYENYSSACRNKINIYESEIDSHSEQLNICQEKIKNSYIESKKFGSILKKIILQKKLKIDFEEANLLEEINQKLHNS